jgi:gluconolactonase
MPYRLTLALTIALVVLPTPGSAKTRAAKPAAATETVIAGNVMGPEGPLWVDGKLYYVSWNPGSLMMWDGRSNKLINNTKNCGHNGLALTRHKTLLVACSAEKGAILELDLDGKELRRWTTDDQHEPFDGGINDVATTPDGGAYATIFGPFAETPTRIEGAVLYLAPGAKSWIRKAESLNYANGIAVSPDGRTLYVAEMVDNAIIKFEIEPDGNFGDRSNFVRLNMLVPDKAAKWWAGPDSMKVDRNGNLYAAQFYGGRILKISPEGKLLHVFDIKAGNGTTNVAFGEGEKKLYVSVVANADDVTGEARGSIVEIANWPR